jgi:uncharacterized membrane protein
MPDRQSSRPGLGPGIWLGLGLGGFFDGIVLHQLLQWHHMISVPYPPTTLGNLELNTLWDGLFHVAAYAMVVVGVVLLWRARRAEHAWSIRPFTGALLMGWGIFNLGEGLLDHQLLGIHHVRPGPHQLAWDLGFLAWGGGMLLVGWVFRRLDQWRTA